MQRQNGEWGMNHMAKKEISAFIALFPYRALISLVVPSIAVKCLCYFMP